MTNNIISVLSCKLASHYCFYVLISFFLIQTQTGTAQLNFVRYDSIPITISGNIVKSAWAGGLNSPQFSRIDLNGDGIKDLFVFERNWDGRVKTFINNGTPNIVDYVYAPEYQPKFPPLANWTLLVDYNCDGKEDIFTKTTGGIAVYRNDYDAVDGLQFTLVSSLLYTEGFSGPVNLYVSSPDLPAIVDIDNDGDVDILTFGIGGSAVEYHKNLSMENYGTCDSLDFELKNTCWGYFYESGLNNSVTLFDTCLGNVANPEKTSRHSGSTLLALDMFGNGVKDLVLGDVSFSNMVMLTNGGTITASSMVAYDASFPSNSLPVNLPIFPAGFYLDVDNDGKKDILVAPNSPNVSENFASVWYYKNTGTATTPVFTYQIDNFIQEDMIEVGTGANPVFFDYDADDLLDIIIGNYGYYNGGNYLGELSLYKNIGTLNNPAFELITRDYAGISSYGLNGIYPAFGDLDSDDDDDMILGDYNGELHYFNNTAGSGNPANFVLSQPNYKGIDIGQFAAPQIVDVNRDGILDLLVGERSGTLNYFENIGTITSPNFSSTPTNDFFGGIDMMIPCCTGYSTPFLVKDSVGDYVLFVGSERGYLYQYNNIDGNLTGNFNIMDSLYLDGLNISISGGDMNNNGKLELIYGEWFGGIAVLKNGAPTSLGRNTNSVSKIDYLVYPNPSNGEVNIEFLNSFPVNKGNFVEVYNLLGTKVISKEIHPENRLTLDLTHNLPGIYFCRVIVKNESSVVKKLILH